MALYRYEAVDKSGRTVMGAMQAPTEADVVNRLAHMGYQPLQVYAPAGSAKAGSRQTQRSVPRGRSPDAQSLAIFFRELAALQRAGIAPFQALSELASRTRQPLLAEAAGFMSQQVHGGGRISDAMEVFANVFPPHVVGAVRAGEVGGFLPVVLDEVALEYEQEMAFYKGLGIARAFVWQGLIGLAIAQPVFPALFPEPHWRLYLKLLFVRNLPILIAFVLLGKWVYAWWRRPQNSAAREHWALRVPVFGDLARQRALAAFVRMLYRLYAAGISPAAAWEAAVAATPNAPIRNRLVEAYALVKTGVPLHEAFRTTGLFANEVESLLATGVVSGQVVEMLGRVAEYYQNNVDRAFQEARFWMFRLFIIAAIVITGAILILLVKTYFNAVFDFPRTFFPELNQ